MNFVSFKPLYKKLAFWLESYINSPKAKYHYAEKVGVPVGLWKDCFYALIMGAQAENQFGAIYKNISSHFQEVSKGTKVYRKFLKVVKEPNENSDLKLRLKR